MGTIKGPGLERENKTDLLIPSSVNAPSVVPAHYLSFSFPESDSCCQPWVKDEEKEDTFKYSGERSKRTGDASHISESDVQLQSYVYGLLMLEFDKVLARASKSGVGEQLCLKLKERCQLQPQGDVRQAAIRGTLMLVRLLYQEKIVEESKPEEDRKTEEELILNIKKSTFYQYIKSIVGLISPIVFPAIGIFLEQCLETLTVPIEHPLLSKLSQRSIFRFISYVGSSTSTPSSSTSSFYPAELLDLASGEVFLSFSIFGRVKMRLVNSRSVRFLDYRFITPPADSHANLPSLSSKLFVLSLEWNVGFVRHLLPFIYIQFTSVNLEVPLISYLDESLPSLCAVIPFLKTWDYSWKLVLYKGERKLPITIVEGTVKTGKPVKK
eukprot:gnl/Carplike_NY0171/2943_a3962_391.p1 GENE.gnl/Carplike_NY0171/2943_a3962_391~~gnl/Carplike_NY0171/2943_a3962_391.p1  ORF type:complete len:430 (+),score=87.07 gnl/Carplike_NY0171/2943_a3962_391:146-1291(+)